MSEIKIIKNCRSCDSADLKLIISLGNQYITNFVDSNAEGVLCPLELILCKNCKLLQLKHNAPDDAMWGEQYWYKSGISTTIKDDLRDIVQKSEKLKKLQRGDVVVDIGCNDGTLLGFYNKSLGAVPIGFEPSKNVAREAESKGFNIINNFFNSEDFKRRFGSKKASVITAISMFYDLEYPNQFLRDIVSILDKNGLLVIQQNYLKTMLQHNAFDNISHEHREYYSLISFKNLLDRHDLEVFDIEFNGINGGSIRTYIRAKGNQNLHGFEGAEERINETFLEERKIGLDTLEPYEKFAGRISKIKEDILSFLKKEKDIGKKIWIYGASTRGNVALQYFDLDAKIIDGIADKNQDKWGKKTIGTLIPIDSPEKMRMENPDYILVNTWHFFDEIKRQEEDWFKKDGTFVVALPEFRIIKND